ncbi:MAG: class II fructose-bisphosphatase [Alphaproteobacteria bacterium]
MSQQPVPSARRGSRIDRNLALDAVRVTEAAALAASRCMGRGDEMAADQAAITAAWAALENMPIDGVVVIGEGERDVASRLFVGEPVGTGDGPKIDIAIDALEGNTITAKGAANALSFLAMAEFGGFLKVPPVYMDKIIVGSGLPEDVVDLDEAPVTNLRNLARALGSEVDDLVVCILDRPRHEELIARVREAGARIVLIADGDVAGGIAVCEPASGVDMYLGRGGASEGVLAAAALCCAGGQMQGRLLFRNDAERDLARKQGITDLDRKYSQNELARGNLMVAATGVTDSAMLRGVRRSQGRAVTQSIVMRSRSGTIRHVEARHDLTHKEAPGPRGTGGPRGE